MHNFGAHSGIDHHNHIGIDVTNGEMVTPVIHVGHNQVIDPQTGALGVHMGGNLYHFIHRIIHRKKK